MFGYIVGGGGGFRIPNSRQSQLLKRGSEEYTEQESMANYTFQWKINSKYILTQGHKTSGPSSHYNREMWSIQIPNI